MECEYLERSGEEQEKLQRSNKRVKDSSSDGGHGEEETEMGNPLPKSYKDKLLVVIPGAHAQMCIANNQQYGKEYFDNEMDEVTEEFAVVKSSPRSKVSSLTPSLSKFLVEWQDITTFTERA